VTAELWDDGAPLDVDLDAPEPPDTATSGRGLLLVRRAVDSVALTREGDRNVWRLERGYRGR
jgi:anti-sigma regulatory factor (Ser/Thr protein kinase)